MNMIHRLVLRAKQKALLAMPAQPEEWQVTLIDEHGDAYLIHRGENELEAFGIYKEQRYPCNLIHVQYDPELNTIDKEVLGIERLRDLEGVFEEMGRL